jgi:hypothetical protein
VCCVCTLTIQLSTKELRKIAPFRRYQTNFHFVPQYLCRNSFVVTVLGAAQFKHMNIAADFGTFCGIAIVSSHHRLLINCILGGYLSAVLVITNPKKRRMEL